MEIIQAEITPSFQETVGDIFQRPHSFWKSMLEKPAFGHELEKDNCDLQQKEFAEEPNGPESLADLRRIMQLT